MASLLRRLLSRHEETRPKYLDCYICSDLMKQDRLYVCGKDGESPESIREQLFHQDCQNCEPLQAAEPFCGFCRHLRLNHIMDMACHGDTGLIEVKVMLDPLEDLFTRQHCAFCRLVSAILTRDELFREDQRIILDTSVHKQNIDVRYGRLNLYLVPRGDGLFSDERTKFATIDACPKSDRETVSQGEFRIDQAAQSRMDWEKIKKYLDSCSSKSQNHRCAAQDSHPPPPGFRVIDAQERCIIQVQQPCEYIALSYVWGISSRATEGQATTKNIDHLEMTGSLSDEKLPQTIRDAICVCNRLGKRYLWVDRYCILQDVGYDDEIKKGLINAMGDIYRSAFLTLVAADGVDVESGLCGVSRSMPPPQNMLRLHSMTLEEARASPATAVKKSKWATRGWTYQEAVLSRRVLYFTKQGVFYECTKNWHNQTTSVFLSRFEFQEHVRNYVSRQLTYKADVLRAFTGILNHHGESHRHGIALRDLEEAILWFPKDRAPPRSPGTHDVFPTWSWISADSSVTFLKAPQRSRLWAVASWAVYDDELQHPHLKHIQPVYEEYRDDDSALPIIALKEGLIVPQKVQLKFKYKYYDRLSWARHSPYWYSYWGFWVDARGVDNSVDPPSFLRRFSEDEIEEARIPGRVLLYTQHIQVDRFKKTGDAFIVGDDHGPLGYVRLDNNEKDVVLSGKPAILQLVALALTWWSDLHGMDPTALVGDPLLEVFYELGFNECEWKVASKGLCIPDSSRKYSDAAPMLYVMAIETQGSISRRIGIGKVFLKRWISTGPMFGTFVLA